MNEPISRHVDDVEAGLVRDISLRALTANIVNQTVGSGIFVLPAVVAAILGPASVLGYLACAMFMVLVGLCLATLALRRRDGGNGGATSRVPAGPVIPVAASGVILWLLSSAGRSEVVVVAAILAIASALYALRQKRAHRRGPAAHSGETVV